MSERPVANLLDDMWEALEKIERYTAGLSQAIFIKDEKSSDAVVRNLEIIGEAANRLPEDYRNRNPDIEWSKIIGLRHRIVHDYFGIDLDIVWNIVQENLPPFKEQLNKLRRNNPKLT